MSQTETREAISFLFRDIVTSVQSMPAGTVGDEWISAVRLRPPSPGSKAPDGLKEHYSHDLGQVHVH